MKQHISHKELIDKTRKLHEISLVLKERFLGLDTIIDEVIALMMPWYLFPESQLRPTVINLWGLTGSGKTALVKEMANLLDHRSLSERMIFGEEFTSSGVYSDIEEASSLAHRAITKYAMGVDPIHMAVESKENAFEVPGRYAEESIRLIRACEVEAEQILMRNKLLLLKMSEYLTVNSKMDAALIEAFVKQYANESWVKDGLIQKDQYYAFNTILQKKLKEVEAGVATEVDTLLKELELVK